MDKLTTNPNNIDIESRITILETEIKRLKEVVFAGNKGDYQLKSQKKMSVKEFLLTKNIDNDVKRTLTIAYFMEKFDNAESFNVEDLKKYFQLAKHQLPPNPNDKVNQGIGSGFLMEATEKKDSKKAWTLTATGEKFVENNFQQ